MVAFMETTGPSPVAASLADPFPPGATVECKTCHGDTFLGDVIGFDRATQMLALRQKSDDKLQSGGKSAVHLLNLELLSNVEVVKEPTGAGVAPVLPPVNSAKMAQKLREGVDKKKSMMSTVPIAPEGQSLFIAIRKTIDRVRWDEQRIIVLNDVSIGPPYGTEDVKKYGSSSNPRQEDSLNHVRKIVERHVKLMSGLAGASDMSASDVDTSAEAVQLAEAGGTPQENSGGRSGGHHVMTSSGSYSSASSAAAEKTSNSSNGPSPPPPGAAAT